MRAILTPEDLKSTERPPTPAGWYPSEIVKYEEAVTKGTDAKPSDGSINAIFYFKILDAPSGAEHMKGRELRRYLNEKSLKWGKNMYAALNFPRNGQGGYEVSSELFKQTVGSKLMIYVKLDNKTGYDSIEDYKAMP